MPLNPVIVTDVVTDVLSYPDGAPAEPYTGSGNDPAATITKQRVVGYTVADEMRNAAGKPAQTAIQIARADLVANPPPGPLSAWQAKVDAALAAGSTDRQVLDAILATLLLRRGAGQ